MKFKIDKRYIAKTALETFAGWLLANFLVIYFGNHNDPWGFVVSTLVVAILLYCFYYLPKPIVVEYGFISFDKKYSTQRCDVKLEDIIAIEKSHKFYNTITLVAQSGIYELHPQDPELLEKTLIEEKQKAKTSD